MIPLEANCASCIIETAVKIIESSHADQMKKINAVKKALNIMANNFSKDYIAVDIANVVFRSIYESLDVKDPLAKLKMDSNNMALAIIPQIKEIIDTVNSLDLEQQQRIDVVLNDIGITQSVIRKLKQTHGENELLEAIDVYQFLKNRGRANGPGFLIEYLRSEWSPPPDYQPNPCSERAISDFKESWSFD